MLTDDSIEDIERITATGTDCLERKLCVKAVRNLSGNKECADCSSSEGYLRAKNYLLSIKFRK